MKQFSDQQKFRFLLHWILLSFLIIPVSYLLSLIIVLLVHTVFGFSITEWGSPLSQTLMQIAGGIVIATGTGLYQKALLRKQFPVTNRWIYALIIGFVVTEGLAGIFFALLHLNRGEYRFIEFRPFPEAIIFALAGLLSGLMQHHILKRIFAESGWWIMASAIGWALCIAVTQLSIWAFLPGTFLYGAITGGTIVKILSSKKMLVNEL